MGTHTSDTCPHTAKVFLGRPTTQKGSKKRLRTQKVQKKPDQNLPHEKGQKKAFGSKSEKRP